MKLTGRDTAMVVAAPAEAAAVPGSVDLFLTAPGTGFETLPPGFPYSRLSEAGPDDGFLGNEGGALGPWYGLAYYRAPSAPGASDAFATREAVTGHLGEASDVEFGLRTATSLDLPGGGRIQAFRTDFTFTGDAGDPFEGRMMAFDANGFVLVAFAWGLQQDASGAFSRLEALVGSAWICTPGQSSNAEHVY